MRRPIDTNARALGFHDPCDEIDRDIRLNGWPGLPLDRFPFDRLMTGIEESPRGGVKGAMMPGKSELKGDVSARGLLNEADTFMSALVRAPTVTIIPKENEYLMVVDVPGTKKQDVKVTLSYDNTNRPLLTIIGERKDETMREDRDKQSREYLSVFGRFMRTVKLPEDAQVQGILARHEDGVLKLTIPRLMKQQQGNKPMEIKLT